MTHSQNLMPRNSPTLDTQLHVSLQPHPVSAQFSKRNNDLGKNFHLQGVGLSAARHRTSPRSNETFIDTRATSRVLQTRSVETRAQGRARSGPAQKPHEHCQERVIDQGQRGTSSASILQHSRHVTAGQRLDTQT